MDYRVFLGPTNFKRVGLIFDNSISSFGLVDKNLSQIEKKNLSKVEKLFNDNNIHYENIGFTQKNYLEIEGNLKIATKDLFKINNEWYNNY